jgi:predicted DNA-binding ribbon-helix-helix protein
MRAMLVCRNLFVHGHRTSMRLEPEMWSALEEIAGREQLSLHALVSRVANGHAGNLTSAVRCFVITYYVERAVPPATSRNGVSDDSF